MKEKLRLYKKAQFGLYDFIFQIVIVAAAGILLFMYVNLVAGDTTYAKLYFSRELAFDNTVVYSAPSNLVYFPLYSFPPDAVNKFVYKIGGGDVSVSAIKYYYMRDSCFEEHYPNQIENVSYIYVQNRDYDMTFGIGTFEGKRLKYPFADTKDSFWKTKKFTVSPEKYAIIFKGYGIEDVSTTYSEGIEGYFRIEDFDKQEEIKILIPVKTALRSRKLASIMANKFFKEDENLSITISFSREETMGNAGVAFILQAGTDVDADVADVVLKSLREYYEGGIC